MSEEVRETRSKLTKEAYDDCDLYLAIQKYKGTKQIFEGWTYYVNLGRVMFLEVNLGRVMFLEGCDEGAARCFHPDNGLYCAWWSRWARVATFKKEFESGAMRY